MPTKSRRFLSISTKTGDQGETGLANGQRLAKSDPLFGVLGDLDELNSWLGFAIVELPAALRIQEEEFLLSLQHDLYIISAELAGSPRAKYTAKALTAFEVHSEELQQEMQETWMAQFLYPGGSRPGAVIDIARTVCRRAERTLVIFATDHSVSPVILALVNRLSDYLYILRCHANAETGAMEKNFSV